MRACRWYRTHHHHHLQRVTTIRLFPDSHKQAWLTARLKKLSLNPENLNSFRPISNLSFLSKIIARVVVNSSSIMQIRTGFSRAVRHQLTDDFTPPIQQCWSYKAQRHRIVAARWRRTWIVDSRVEWSTESKAELRSTKESAATWPPSIARTLRKTVWSTRPHEVWLKCSFTLVWLCQPQYCGLPTTTFNVAVNRPR